MLMTVGLHLDGEPLHFERVVGLGCGVSGNMSFEFSS